MWAPLAETLVGNRTVVVPDLRGMGLWSHPNAFGTGSFSKLAMNTSRLRAAPSLAAIPLISSRKVA